VRETSGLVRLLGGRSRPEIRWVSKVVRCTPEEAQAAVDDVAGQADSVRELIANIKTTGRTYYAQFPAPIDLFALVRLTKPKTIVESGVASGVSSTFMLLGTEANSEGILHSIDLPVARERKGRNESWAIPDGLSSGWAVPSKLKNRWDLREGRSEELLAPLLREVGFIDLYCHDSPVDLKHFQFEMDAIREYLKPGSVIVSDNTDREVFDQTARAVGASAFYRRGSSLGAFRVPFG
jgi:Methyltransferase domain